MLLPKKQKSWLYHLQGGCHNHFLYTGTNRKSLLTKSEFPQRIARFFTAMVGFIAAQKPVGCDYLGLR
jgi:hypothetical protein